MKYLGRAFALCLITAMVSYAVYAKTASAPGTGETATAAQENKAADANADKWQEGTACVKQTAPDCPAQYRGACRSARATGCSHDICTAAKNQAKATLRAAVPAACHKYIQATAPCKNGPGCK